MIKGLLRRVAIAVSDRAIVESVFVRLVRWNPDLVSRAVGRQVEKACIPLVASPAVESLLSEVPSEATLDERRFLYQFFSNIWSGRNTVIEIGPFLGGTTRAIALGMNDNPRVTAEAKLLTFDRFSHYYDADALKNFLEPMVRAGVLLPDDLDMLGSPAGFFDLFVKIHRQHDYYARIMPRSLSLPDKPKPLSTGDLFALEGDAVSDAVFVDGCKSWFGTKYFMREVAKAVRAGTYFIFQDFGHYTCFWIAAFMGLFREHFRLVSFVDDTYTFVLTKPLTAEKIDERYPDVPSGLSENEFVRLYDRFGEEAKAAGDYYAAARHAMHKAAALAYLGNKSRAKAILTELAAQSWARSQVHVIQRALISPTYTPDGEIYLD